MFLLIYTSVSRYSGDYWWDNTPIAPNSDKRSEVIWADTHGAAYLGYAQTNDPYINAELGAIASAVQARKDFLNWWNS